MRRRDILAGLGSLGVIGAGGVLAIRGVPSVDDGADEDEEREPVELETLEATGSEAGTITVPAEGQVMVVDFFATWCDVCEDEMPTLAEANERIDDENVQFVWATTEILNPSEDDKASIVEGWESDFVVWDEESEHDWTLAVDSGFDLTSQYDAEGQVPTTVVIDEEGETYYRSTGGGKVADEIVDAVETALEAQ